MLRKIFLTRWEITKATVERWKLSGAFVEILGNGCAIVTTEQVKNVCKE